MITISPISLHNSSSISYKSKSGNIKKVAKNFSLEEIKAFEKGFNDVISGKLPKETLAELRMSAAMSGSPTSLRYLEGMANAESALKNKI